jgi:uncharacterized tellurite resistance protein B-like protein
MNFSFLPEKIKSRLKKFTRAELPVSVVRSNASLEGKPGEGYVIAYKDKVFVFSRQLGDGDYTELSADMGQIASVDVKRDGINTVLDINIGERKYSLNFSSFEEGNLRKIADSWSSLSGDQQCSSQEPESFSITVEGTLDRKVGLAAAMMYLASVDGDIAREEDYYIIAMMDNNREVLKAALSYYKTHTFEQLLDDLAGLSDEQKLCYLANMMELGMKDGVLHSSELKLIKKFAESMDISGDQYTTIKQVLIIKNKISVLNA